MNGFSLIPIFLIGLLGSVHCIGMCGGIVAALSSNLPQKPFPVAVMGSVGTRNLSVQLSYVLFYNAGRIVSYMVTGAIAGGTLHGVLSLANFSIIQSGGYWLANLMLIGLGLYLMGIWSGIAQLEQVGALLWKCLRPIGKSLLPPDTPIKIFALGALWGWLPCGMVYSMLLTAMLTGSAQGGAITMLAFGLGTLPTLFSLGMLGTQLRNWSKQSGTRLVCGLIVLSFGALGLYRAISGGHAGWLDVLCLHPVALS